jgi:hypothetical protein
MKDHCYNEKTNKTFCGKKINPNFERAMNRDRYVRVFIKEVFLRINPLFQCKQCLKIFKKGD